MNDFCCITDKNELAIHVLAFMCSSLYSYMYLYILNNCKSLGEGCSSVRFSSYYNAPAWSWEYRNALLDGGVRVAQNLQFSFSHCGVATKEFSLNSNAYSLFPLFANIDKYNLLNTFFSPQACYRCMSPITCGNFSDIDTKRVNRWSRRNCDLHTLEKINFALRWPSQQCALY